ncbi:MAG: NAD(P)H:quinone oxidoreductase [Polyangiaceae bacterium]|nr:NAD(P)H:quinone oxidoreductase [Polyangiaceae bacterium]
MANIAVIYYSTTGTNHAIAQAVGEGAKAAGADVRVRLVAETLPPEVVAKNPAWQAFVEKTRDFPKASLDDLEWADGVVFGTPTRFGNVAAQLKAFIDSAGGLWFHGKLANKVYSGFTSTQNVHGGSEATLLALYQSFHHFGGVIASPGYTDPVVFGSGGNPYGVSHATGQDGAPPTEQVLTTARYLGRRVAELAAKLRG